MYTCTLEGDPGREREHECVSMCICESEREKGWGGGDTPYLLNHKCSLYLFEKVKVPDDSFLCMISAYSETANNAVCRI